MQRKRTRAQRENDDREIRQMVFRVNEALDVFERRFPMASLKLVDPDLHAKLQEQLEWFRESSVVDPEYGRVMEEGAASLRGLIAATDRMEQEDEVVICWSEELGGHIVISHSVDPPDFRANPENDVVMTPAEIVDYLLAHPTLLECKRKFPGCTFHHRREGNGHDGEEHTIAVDIMHKGREIDGA